VKAPSKIYVVYPSIYTAAYLVIAFLLYALPYSEGAVSLERILIVIHPLAYLLPLAGAYVSGMLGILIFFLGGAASYALVLIFGVAAAKLFKISPYLCSVLALPILAWLFYAFSHE
jgi:hypothetical protein